MIVIQHRQVYHDIKEIAAGLENQYGVDCPSKNENSPNGSGASSLDYPLFVVHYSQSFFSSEDKDINNDGQTSWNGEVRYR